MSARDYCRGLHDVKKTTLTLKISKTRAAALKAKAEQYVTPLEDRLIASVENLFSQPAKVILEINSNSAG